MSMKVPTLLLLWLGLLLNCSSVVAESRANPKADLRKAVATIARTVLIPSVGAFADRSVELRLAVAEFCRDPDRQRLLQAQVQWKASMQSWQRLVVLPSGPNREGQLAPLYWQIDSHLIGDGKKTKAIRKAIKRAISKANTISQQSLARQKITTRGLPAVELLLFETLSQTTALSAIVADYTGERGQRKCQYLQAMVSHIEQLADYLRDAWQTSDPDDVRWSYVNLDSVAVEPKVGDVFISKLINGLISALDTIENKKLAALFANEGERTFANRVESKVSQQSLANIEANLIAIDGVFKANYDGRDGYGLDDRLRDHGASEVVEQYQRRYDQVMNAVAAITVPLAAALRVQPENVQQLLADVRQLATFFRLEVSDALSVAVTFNDTDGDF